MKLTRTVLQEDYNNLTTALKLIIGLGGNLSDETLEKVGGVNDGKDRAIKYIYARKIADSTLKNLKEKV